MPLKFIEDVTSTILGFVEACGLEGLLYSIKEVV